MKREKKKRYYLTQCLCVLASVGRPLMGRVDLTASLQSTVKVARWCREWMMDSHSRVFQPLWG